MNDCPCDSEAPTTDEVVIKTAGDLEREAAILALDRRLRIVETEVTTPKRVALLGTAQTSRMDAPFYDDSWEIWGTGTPAGVPRWTRWFELHPDVKGDRGVRDTSPADYILWLRAPHGRPVYIQAKTELVPEGLIFPVRKVVKFFGGRHAYDAFSSSAAWMAAYALMRGAKEIGFWGIDMAAEDEWGYQRAGLKTLLVAAHFLGVKIVLPPQSDLNNYGRLYGYSDESPAQKVIMGKKGQYDKLFVQKEQEERAAQLQKTWFAGMSKAMEYVHKSFPNPMDPLEGFPK